MAWLVFLAAVAVADFAWVAARARREWSRSDELSPLTGFAISSLYVAALALFAVAIAHRPWPISVPLAAVVAVGGAAIIAGVALVVAGARPFGSAARLYGVETVGLIEGGVYRISRNPQYAGLILIAFGIGAIARSILMVVIAFGVAAGFWVWVVAVEEPHLAQAFGPRFREYRRRVPRFLGRPGHHGG